MELLIRENREKYLEELRSWLVETEKVPLETMGGFFTRRVHNYEEPMFCWKEGYQRMAELIPANANRILDLGYGIGLELDAIFSKYPELSVTGIDLCKDMLDELDRKHGNRKRKLRCEDSFQADFGNAEFDAALSFESLHHFLPERNAR